MNGLQKDALQKKLHTVLVDIYGDDFYAVARSLLDIGGNDVATAIRQALNQAQYNPNFGLSSFLKSINEAVILQMAKHYSIDIPDLSGRFANESDRCQWELFFDGREYHEQVIIHAKALFLNKHYTNSVHEACKAYIKALQDKSGSHRDGTDLMSVLSSKGGNVKFNALLTESERNYQQGLEQISRGAVLAFRNVAAHDTAKSLNISAIEALDMLTIVSFLLKALDKATVDDGV